MIPPQGAPVAKNVSQPPNARQPMQGGRMMRTGSASQTLQQQSVDRAETPTSYQKLGSLREASPMRVAAPQVLCFGDFGELLRFNLSQLRWEKLKYDT